MLGCTANDRLYIRTWCNLTPTKASFRNLSENSQDIVKTEHMDSLPHDHQTLMTISRHFEAFPSLEDDLHVQ
jgi:hypothetical protein